MILKLLTRYLFLAFLSIMLFSSCATIFNTPFTDVNIYSDEPVSISVNDEYRLPPDTIRRISVKRENKLLELQVDTDSLSKTAFIKPKNSFAYWLNLNTSYLIGFLVDMNSDKRYTYPKFLEVSTDGEVDILTARPFPKTLDRKNNILKFTPLKVVGMVNPSVELAWERKVSEHFALQVMGSWLLPRVLFANYKVEPHINGYRFAVEPRYYIDQTFGGLYFATEIDYLRNDYRIGDYFGPDPFQQGFDYYFHNQIATYEEVGLVKETLSFNLKAGYQTYLSNRIFVDGYFGLGLRYKHTLMYDRPWPQNSACYEDCGINFFALRDKTGEYFTVSMPFNIRIGFIF